MSRQLPEDMNDFTPEDWEVWLEREAERFEDTKSVLFDVFCDRCGAAGWWRFDGRFGVRELAFYLADAVDATHAFKLEDDPTLTAEERDFHSYVVQSFMDDAERALHALVKDGLVELYIDDGWPFFRPVDGYEAIAVEGDNDLAEERMRRQLEHRWLDYQEYLQTEEWQARRKRKLAEAGHRCQVCGSTKRLEVHHRTYERRGNELMSDLLVLCRECHGTFHQSGRKVGQ